MVERVAVIEDEPLMQELVAGLLRGRGWEVRVFDNCREADAGLARWSPDLLVVDVDLPDGSGLELVDRVRDREGRRVPAIVLSGRTSEQDIARGFSAGAVDFVGKPFRSNDLVARCSVHLARQLRQSATTRDMTARRLGLPCSGGRIFGRFDIERELGRGSQGCVVLVRDRERGGEPVALKVVRAPTAEARTRFIRETYSLSQLQHPNVAAIRDVGAYDGWLFYTMNFVDGPTLQARAAGAPLSAQDCRALALGLLHALEALECAGVIHRDLKPANVVLRDGDPGQPVLVDFGLARGVADQAITAASLIMGTLRYLSPEVIDGGDHTHLSDLFAAGLTLRFAFLGECAFPHLRGAALQDALADEQVMLLREGLAPDLMCVVSGLLERLPERRLPSAAVARAVLSAGVLVG